jgi:hypothetical protein
MEICSRMHKSGMAGKTEKLVSKNNNSGKSNIKFLGKKAFVRENWLGKLITSGHETYS